MVLTNRPPRARRRQPLRARRTEGPLVPREMLAPLRRGTAPPRPPQQQPTPVNTTAPPVGGLQAPSAAGIQYAAPPTTESASMRAAAEQALGSAGNSYRDSVFRAAMSLGDPKVLQALSQDPSMAGYNFSSVDPNSLMQQLKRSETEGLTGIDQATNANNAFFSGFRLQDRSKLSDDVQRQRLAGQTQYSDALKQYAAALAAAQGQYGLDIGTAAQMEADAAAAADPTAAGGGKFVAPLKRAAPKTKAEKTLKPAKGSPPPTKQKPRKKK